MARVSRGVTTHARHKKVIKRAKGYYGRIKMFSELLFRLSKEHNNTLIEIEEKEKVTLGVFGYNVLMQVSECME